MEGPKQHYIPQWLLRGFGKQGAGKFVQVTVYTNNGRVFTTATLGIGAQRNFYSDLPDGSGVETLNQKITTFESGLSNVIEEFRGVAPGCAVDATKAGEAVTHLCVRQAYVRNSLASATGHLLSGVASLFESREWLWNVLELDKATTNEMMPVQIRKLYDQRRDQIDQRNLTEPEFEQFAFDIVKAEFDRNFSTQSALLQRFFAQLRAQTAKMARDGHVNALGQSLAPDPRIEVLKRFAWTIEPGPASGFILPDCVVTSWSEGTGFQPLFYAGNQVDAVFMPVRYDRLLVGQRGQAVPNVLESMNEVSAACSRDFFVARDRIPEFQELIPRIGERARRVVDEAVQAALDELKK